jgi:sporulation-control protein
VPQTLPFYQEIEFFPPSYAHGINEVEVTFVAGPHAMGVVLEVDKRGGVFHGGQDVVGHLQVDYPTADRTDWAAQIDAWLRQLVQRGAHYGQPAPGYAPGHGYPGGHGPAGPTGYYPGQHRDYDHHGPDDHHRHGSGMGAALGGAAVGAAAGFAAGMVADEAFEEVGDFFGGDEED